MSSSKSLVCGLVFCLYVVGAAARQRQLSYDVIYEWKQLDFDYKTEADRRSDIKSRNFIRENNVITGIKVYKNTVYLTVPRWRSGVPATLVYLPYDAMHQQKVSEPKLKPFPSWEMNKRGNCNAFQFVQSMEIDQFGRMWVIDTGRIRISEDHPDNKCPPKLVIIDLNNNNKVLKIHVFPERVVGRTTGILNDIVVGCNTQDDCWAYITDSKDGKIVVYNYGQDKSWYLKQDESMRPQQEAKIIHLEGKNYTFNTAVDGIALAPYDKHFRSLYYTPLSSYHLYCICNLDAIKEQLRRTKHFGIELRPSQVADLGRRKSQTDGMIMDAAGNLYYGLLGDNSIYKFNTEESGLTEQTQHLLMKNDKELQWPDTFAIDERGDGFVTTNRLHRYTTKTMDIDKVNIRVIRFHLGVLNYMRPRQGGRQ